MHFAMVPYNTALADVSCTALLLSTRFAMDSSEPHLGSWLFCIHSFYSQSMTSDNFHIINIFQLQFVLEEVLHFSNTIIWIGFFKTINQQIISS